MLLALLSISPAANAQDAPYGKPITIELGHYRYSIPKNYFRLPPKTGCNAEVMSLIGLLPDFEGRTEDNTDKFVLVDPKHREYAMTLVQVDRKRGEKAHKGLEILYNLRKKKGSYTQTQYPVYGLNYFHPETTGTLKSKDDLFEKRDEHGVLQTFIECRTLGGGVNSGCNHQFSVHDLTIKVNYNRPYLYQWREIEKNITDFINNAVVERIEPSAPFCDHSMQTLISRP
jgi:hypothetical protein